MAQPITEEPMKCSQCTPVTPYDARDKLTCPRCGHTVAYDELTLNEGETVIVTSGRAYLDS
jgi:hypothetical protein